MTEDLHNTHPCRIDEKSFEAIYRRYWEKVYAVCYSNLRKTEPAKEMVQEIFKSLWERREELEINTSVERYLLRSAKFKVFEYLRNVRTRHEHDEAALAGYTGMIHCTENEVMFNSLKSKLEWLVEALPAQCRKVFRMSREQGLSNKEIASSLLISERAVEYHITRALANLRTNLTEYDH